ncbi:MAG: DNA polymerase I [bacterium]
MTTLFLIDGSSYLYRAFHGLPPLTTKQGQPTGAIFGVINMLRRLLDEVNPSHVGMIFDAPGKTFRHEMYDQYKANRPPMPDDLREQIEPLKELIEALGFPLISVPNVEADDVIGTLAKQARAKGWDVVISSGDKDLAQLVEPGIELVDTMKNKQYNSQVVFEKFGVHPEQIIDLLGLMGDSSDNIPGVPKVGQKTAAKWLNKYQSVDNIIAHAGEIKGKVGESLREHIEQLKLSQELATINTALDLDINLDELNLKPVDQAKSQKMFKDLQFYSWLDEDESAEQLNQQHSVSDYQIIQTQTQWDEWLDKIKKAELLCLDTETTSLNPMLAEMVGISVCIEPGTAAYIPFIHENTQEQLSRDAILADLKPLLEDPEYALVGQHLKYDWHIFRNLGIELNGIQHDTMLESYVLNSLGRHNMDAMAERYLDLKTIHFEDIAGKGAKQLRFDQIPLDKAGEYAAEDADITLKLHQHLWPQLEEEENLKAVYQSLEIPLIRVLMDMEHDGVLIDENLLNQQSNELEQRMLELQQQCHNLAGYHFNLGSPKQLQQILFEELGLPVIRKTPKGQPSTAEDVLQELSAEYELPRLILEFRSLSKLKSTYTDSLPQRIHPETGRVHTSYHQAVAATGRLSSSDPNLQNIPIRKAEGRRIRQAFIAPDGYVLLAADYSQVELRIMAHLSGDEGLLAAFREGKDVHSATAAEVFGAEEDGTVKAEHRRAAKAINFGLMYGMSAFGLAKQLHIGRAEAQDYIDLYFSRYPGVRDYMDKTREIAHQNGYVETIFGRRLMLPEINSRNGMRRQAAERAAINAPMQGTAADIIKRAMIAVHHQLQEQQLPARLTMQVHDELVLEVKEQALDEVRSMVNQYMVEAAELDVPLVVDIGVGKNWDEAH